ncbi:MAG: NAD(P)-binding domain-containing protein [Sedimentisphaerales bacterium]|nr:NAD(P)-binding domain-containing protein [Sedimentisphaerales bacterium]
MKLGFIGIGRIASAIVKGLCTSDIQDTTINLSPRNENNSNYLARTFSNVNRLESNQSVLDNSEIIFIAVPPKSSKEILNNLKFKEAHTVISFIPFLTISNLSEVVKPASLICRAIPLPTVVNHDCPIPILNSNKRIAEIFSYIGQPLLVEDENQLHILWTLTGFISSFYDLLQELSDWTISNGVNKTIADKYIVDMYHSLISSPKQENKIDFNELAKHAATPNGMNEQAVKELKAKGTHQAYKIAAENLLKRFISNFENSEKSGTATD